MARTPSNMLPLGTLAPEFKLINTVDDTLLSLADIKGEKGTLIMFICNHCPFVIHVNPKISELAITYQKQGINFVAINSNDILNYPEDAPDLMKLVAVKEHYTFPYLFDESQEVAKAYDAACTPDFYLFDHQSKLVYRGQLDDSRPGNGKEVTGKDLANAMDSLLQNNPINEMQKPSLGCNIKWKNTN
jgi:thiol-disulfide isomerase/thioredoxin